MRALVLADTHLGAGQAPRLTKVIGDRLASADVILHAGDITDASVLDALGEFAPVHAVRGNNDHRLLLPDRLTVELEGCTIAMVHDSGAAAGRGQRLLRWFPDADMVVFGHSHLPWHRIEPSAGGRVQHHLNPGSAVQRRQAPQRTVAWVELSRAGIHSVEHDPLGP